MKREEIQAHIEGITDEQLDWLMGQNGADVNNVRSKLNAATEDNGRLKEQLGELQAQIDAANQASMTADEKLQAQLEAAQKAQRDFAVKSSRLDAKSVFVQAGIPAESMDGLLDLVSSEDGEKSVASAKSIVDLIAAQSAKAVADAEKKLVGKTPGPAGKGSGNGPITREEFDAMDWDDQLKALKKDPNLLKSFN